MDYSKLQRVLLGLGSNRSFNNQSPLELLEGGCKELQNILQKVEFSSIYKTKAMYVEDQSDFYNMAAIGYVDDEKSPFDLLDEIHIIEAKFGRDRSKEIRFGPRSLDIDIELFGDEEVNTADLQIPHIRAEERAFVLVPALEILKESADKKIIERYRFCLKQIEERNGLDGIQKCCSSNSWTKQAVQNHNGKNK